MATWHWIKLEKVEEVYWIEAEDSTAVTLSGANIHSDGDRVEIDADESMTVDLAKVSGFRSGNYKLSVGANGARSELDFKAITDGQTTEGTIPTPGKGWYALGTCEDSSCAEEIGLNESSTITLSDTDNWGHVDTSVWSGLETTRRSFSRRTKKPVFGSARRKAFCQMERRLQLIRFLPQNAEKFAKDS